MSTGDDIARLPTDSEAPRELKRARWAELTLVAALGLYAVLAILAQEYAYFWWDLSLDRSIQSISIAGFRSLMLAISALGSGWVPFVLVALAGAAFYSGRLRLEALTCIAGVAAGTELNTFFKWLVGRPRPAPPLVQVTTIVTRESFPSGHVVFFVEFFGFLLFLTYVLRPPAALRRTAYIVLWTLISLVGVSRVYLGAHWPSDVVGAYLAGGVWLMLMIEFYRRARFRKLLS